MRGVIEFKLFYEIFAFFFLYLTYNFMYNLNSRYFM